MSAIFLGPIGLGGLPENPKPGKDGTITSNESSMFPPNFSGFASFSIMCKNSTIDPGHQCIRSNGVGLEPLPFSRIKCISISSTTVVKFENLFISASCFLQSKSLIQ